MKKVNILILLLFVSYTSISQKLPTIKAIVYDSSLTGYYFISTHYGDQTVFMILDHIGEILYYKPLRHDRGTYNFSLNPNGLMSYANEGNYFFMDSAFNILDSVCCKNIYKNDPHDMKILHNGHYLLLGADSLIMDLSNYNLGKEGLNTDSAKVRRGVIQELDEKKNVVFEWHAKDHFLLEDADTFYIGKLFGYLDVEHINSVAPDADGNILFSSRNFNEITKINRKEGSIMWRLGGKKNQFKFVNCPVPFCGQHDIRRISNGHITLFDGGHHAVPHGARALEFELDEINLIATLKWSYVYDSTMESQVHGNVQRLSNSNSLINYGSVKRDVVYVVVDSYGHKLFELTSPDHLDSYRSFYYTSLPWQLHRPEISCFDSLGVTYLKTTKTYTSYQWSDSNTTRIIPISKPGSYSVFVPYGQGGFISSEKIIVSDISSPCESKPLNEYKKKRKK